MKGVAAPGATPAMWLDGEYEGDHDYDTHGSQIDARRPRNAFYIHKLALAIKSKRVIEYRVCRARLLVSFNLLTCPSMIFTGGAPPLSNGPYRALARSCPPSRR